MGLFWPPEHNRQTQGLSKNRVEETNLNTWEEFEREIKEIRRTRADSEFSLLFRGQANACWTLSPTLERKRDRMLFRDYYRVIHRIHPQIETLVGTQWPIPTYPEVEQLVKDYDKFSLAFDSGDKPAYAYMAYLRHHGFPSLRFWIGQGPRCSPPSSPFVPPRSSPTNVSQSSFSLSAR